MFRNICETSPFPPSSYVISDTVVDVNKTKSICCHIAEKGVSRWRKSTDFIKWHQRLLP